VTKKNDSKSKFKKRGVVVWTFEDLASEELFIFEQES